MEVQVAVDVPTLEEARAYLHRLAPSGVRIEFGAPMVVNEGVAGFSALRQEFPGVTYVDCKTMDFPSLEWGRYIEAGATEITGMLFAEESVVEEMARLNAESARVCVSAMGFPRERLASRVREFIDRGFRCFIAHAANRDRSKAFDTVRGQLDTLCSIEGATIIAAGGVGRENIELLAGYAVGRVIVGRSLADAARPTEALRDLVEVAAHIR